MKQPRDIVLRLILAEIRASLRSARKRDLAWVFLGGGGLLAYAIGIVVLRIHARADAIREMDLVWWLGLPLAMLAAGLLAGWALARLAQARAHAPFLKAQPLDAAARRAMAARAALVLGLPFVAIDGALVTIGALAAEQSWPLAWGIGAAAFSMIGHVAGARLRLRLPYRPPADKHATLSPHRGGIPVGRIDRHRPAWLGSWAGGFTAGRFRPNLRFVLGTIALAVVGVGMATASIVRNSATPGLLGGVAGGVAIFMLVLRCRPLLSPVLRASPLSFTGAVRGLVRLPLALSILFFGALAVPAYAAEPGTLAIPLSGAAGLIALNGAYVAFAAFFAHSRRLAALAFYAALGLAAYESLEYGRTVLLGLAALVIFLWIRARGAYRHG